jgi:hypothetical protein
LAKIWLYEANGGCVGEELKALKYFKRPDKKILLRRSPTPKSAAT